MSKSSIIRGATEKRKQKKKKKRPVILVMRIDCPCGLTWVDPALSLGGGEVSLVRFRCICSDEGYYISDSLLRLFFFCPACLSA